MSIFLIEVQLSHNVAFVSGVQHIDLAVPDVMLCSQV